MEVRIRAFRDEDLPTLYEISLRTGDGGGDATRLYRHREIIGHVYVGPYATLLPDLCLVAEDAEGVAGYLVGVPNTRDFEARQQAEWWPSLRRCYPDPGPLPDPAWDADAKRAHRIHHPEGVIPDAVVAEHPGHLHMNLLPRLQRRGIGSRLLETGYPLVRRAGAGHVHVGVNPGNTGGLTFWQRAGFAPIDLPADKDTGKAIWLGRALP
ncbi:MAG: GNAT family N-acetyltransferase [Nisaea sp.]|uniref:GNAT family N-acetyltransferase n=1 Tax=Nisaea sp. TaxID=2024842 RepID=UPI001B1BACFA|nr:GNAT family N-acetyltransferase [Nisaea sp.]MBO6561571.1 GNAT family N-acetyltransferase [Nisaea sp.]